MHPEYQKERWILPVFILWFLVQYILNATELECLNSTLPEKYQPLSCVTTSCYLWNATQMIVPYLDSTVFDFALSVIVIKIFYIWEVYFPFLIFKCEWNEWFIHFNKKFIYYVVIFVNPNSNWKQFLSWYKHWQDMLARIWVVSMLSEIIDNLSE